MEKIVELFKMLLEAIKAWLSKGKTKVLTPEPEQPVMPPPDLSHPEKEAVQLAGSRNEKLFLRLTATEIEEPLNWKNITVKFFEIEKMEITKPSFKEAVAG